MPILLLRSYFVVIIYKITDRYEILAQNMWFVYGRIRLCYGTHHMVNEGVYNKIKVPKICYQSHERCLIHPRVNFTKGDFSQINRYEE